MIKHQRSRFILGNRWFNRNQIVQSMEAFQDLIVVLLCIGLFCVMVIQLWHIFILLIYPINFKAVTSDILFLLILVELFRLLIIYLQEHSVAVGVAVEVSIVSILREVIVHGALEINWLQLLSICCLLSILGVLLFVCNQTPHMDYPFDTHVHYPNPAITRQQQQVNYSLDGQKYRELQ
jgi:uncharacterized membrane protein (DUF373 family)